MDHGVLGVDDVSAAKDTEGLTECVNFGLRGGRGGAGPLGVDAEEEGSDGAEVDSDRPCGCAV